MSTEPESRPDPIARGAIAALLLALGLGGGLLARLPGLPMPFLVGGLTATGVFTVLAFNLAGRRVVFPQQLRKLFVACIGVMIGASFSRDMVSVLPSLWLVFVAMLVFVALTQTLGYALFRRVGGYDPVTALFAAMPGGLIEAVELGGAAGGDVRILSVQHFARIVIVVLTIPFLFLIWTGESVGSAAGQGFGPGVWGAGDLALIAALALAGLYLGPRLRLPAGHMMGPLLLSAAVHGGGLTETVSPRWLLDLSQLVVGVGLGTMFTGVTLRLILRTFALGLLSVAVMLSIGAGFAAALHRLTPLSFEALFISFAPGGVTEMGLVALSLGVNPVMVSANHLFRITLTVFVVNYACRALGFATRAPRQGGADR
ncbi:AbrB family transcriptional regulator [Halovulum marinum]|uniref:AbrB family transcriptional regulator n=1 Tax=Halovulum marinum TaxID=2662447 RepID=UPI001F1AB865|nr:AbrB family transcriptional regulator [Halovulum marinum]